MKEKRYCKVCNKLLFRQLKYCSVRCRASDAEYRKKYSESMLRKWSDDEYRAKLIEAITTGKNTVEAKSNVRKGQEIRCSKPGEHERLSLMQRERFKKLEEHEKISQGVKNRWKNEEYRRNNIDGQLKSYRNSPVRRQKCVASAIKRYENPEEREKSRQRRLQQIIPFKDTKIEKLLQNFLSENGVYFEKHKPILGQPDIFIEPNICIFCDGDYWHANPEKYNNFDTMAQGKTAQQIKDRDSFITRTLESEGYIVLRFWESDILGNFDFVTKEINKNLMQIIR